jgi:hypothetical protein
MAMFSRLVISLLAFTCASALANQHQLPETSWVLQSYRCPFACVPETEKSVQSRLNERLELDGRELVNTVLGSCSAGDLRAEVKLKPLRQVLDEINVNLPPGMVFTPLNTGIHEQVLNTAHIYCETTDAFPKTLAWVLSLSATEMITFEENATLLVFKSASKTNQK